MAGGLFVFVRTAPPGGCALAITAGQYRPPMAHGPLRKSSRGPFLFIPLGSIAGRDSVFASLSRPRRVSTRRLPLTALAETRRAGLFRFCTARGSRESRFRRCHGGLRPGIGLHAPGRHTRPEAAARCKCACRGAPQVPDNCVCPNDTLCHSTSCESAPLCGPAMFAG